MEVREAIRTRRSIGKLKADPVERRLIEQLLESAVCAPNHYHTEPWRFFVMTGDGRSALAEAYADIAAAEAAPLSAEEEAEVRAKTRLKAYRAPVVIAAAASPSQADRVQLAEELAAVHAAVQNILLTAHDIGLGAIWRTGEPAYHPRMRAAFGLQEHEQLVGFVYVGWPDTDPSQRERASYASKTVWLEG